MESNIMIVLTNNDLMIMAEYALREASKSVPNAPRRWTVIANKIKQKVEKSKKNGPFEKMSHIEQV